MPPAGLIGSGGYALIALGTFFEGEGVMLAAGAAASLGFLSLPLVALSSVVGIFASDTVCFLIGRLAAGGLVRRFPKLAARLDGPVRLIEKHQNRLLLFYQFFPGLCAVTPIAFGMSRIPAARFLLLDLIGNVTWTVAFALAGYLGGVALAPVLDRLQFWAVAVAAIAAITLAVWVWRRFRRQQARRIS